MKLVLARIKDKALYTDLTLNIHNSSENKFCRDQKCSRNISLLMPCLDYSVSITLVTNDENNTV